MTNLFSFIAKPNNYTILHADSLNINDSSPLKFIDGLKFILCIQARIEFWIINQKTPKVLYTSLTKIIKEVNKNSIFFQLQSPFVYTPIPCITCILVLGKACLMQNARCPIRLSNKVVQYGCVLVVDFCVEVGIYLKNCVSWIWRELFRLARKWKPRYVKPRYAGTRCTFHNV